MISLVTGCGGPAPNVTATTTATPNPPLAEPPAGMAEYVNTCGNCHLSDTEGYAIEAPMTRLAGSAPNLRGRHLSPTAFEAIVRNGTSRRMPAYSVEALSNHQLATIRGYLQTIGAVNAE